MAVAVAVAVAVSWVEMDGVFDRGSLEGTSVKVEPDEVNVVCIKTRGH